LSDQWSVQVSASANHIGPDAQAELTEKLNAGVLVDSSTDLLTAVYQVTAPTLRQATDEALRVARALLAKPTKLQVQPLEDWMAEQKRPQPRDLVGAAEAAHLLGVSRQRVGQLAERADFPAPIARLSAGPVWTRASIELFNQNWERKITGRPRKATSA
jgi:hypothetical protein